MDYQLLNTVGAIAGIGGIAFGVFLILFREVIRKNIFPNLTKRDGYRLLLIIVVLVWAIAIAGLGAWVYVSTSTQVAERKNANRLAQIRQELASERQANVALTQKQRELVSVLEMHAVKILEAIDFGIQSGGALYGTPYPSVVEYKSKLSKTRRLFLKLYRAHIEAIGKRDMILAHEIVREIHHVLWISNTTGRDPSVQYSPPEGLGEFTWGYPFLWPLEAEHKSMGHGVDWEILAVVQKKLEEQ